jgi:hypothetical protein
VPKILSELAEDVAVDLGAGLGYVDGQMSSVRGHKRNGKNHQNERDAKDESNTANIHDDSQGECRVSNARDPRDS